MVEAALWVLAVIVFWALVFGLVVFLVRLVSRERGEEQATSEGLDTQATPSPDDRMAAT